ncbi:hypothetical protein M0813_16993 [Anaeramoeba flamelloides]|uniref:Ribosomal protein S3 n=1 Tax=Anaeramoeba flamelloides TaxID=1746091 RepID=A0AAV8AHF6_9EUKA|nr:hypothetical protein M0812_03380 [Anaeramoeba flamelloides]KAJ6249572.1 hypothetical protein M0813_16993 [Anaeramoeba flamelloides]
MSGSRQMKNMLQLEKPGKHEIFKYKPFRQFQSMLFQTPIAPTPIPINIESNSSNNSNKKENKSTSNYISKIDNEPSIDLLEDSMYFALSRSQWKSVELLSFSNETSLNSHTIQDPMLSKTTLLQTSNFNSLNSLRIRSTETKNNKKLSSLNFDFTSQINQKEETPKKKINKKQKTRKKNSTIKQLKKKTALGIAARLLRLGHGNFKTVKDGKSGILKLEPQSLTFMQKVKGTRYSEDYINTVFQKKIRDIDKIRILTENYRTIRITLTNSKEIDIVSPSYQKALSLAYTLKLFKVANFNPRIIGFDLKAFGKIASRNKAPKRITNSNFLIDLTAIADLYLCDSAEHGEESMIGDGFGYRKIAKSISLDLFRKSQIIFSVWIDTVNQGISPAWIKIKTKKKNASLIGNKKYKHKWSGKEIIITPKVSHGNVFEIASKSNDEKKAIIMVLNRFEKWICLHSLDMIKI